MPKHETVKREKYLPQSSLEGFKENDSVAIQLRDAHYRLEGTITRILKNGSECTIDYTIPNDSGPGVIGCSEYFFGKGDAPVKWIKKLDREPRLNR